MTIAELPTPAKRPARWAALTTLGIVYGDLGTSPLYTLQTVVQAIGGHFTSESALGVLSLIVWTLIVTISIKYCLFVMRADNHGEGGILALMSLVGGNGFKRGTRTLTILGLLGAALIYGDGIITPAISVLSAGGRQNVVTNSLKPFILPMAITILVMLFAIQRFGTESIGRAFGPTMLLWFVVIAGLGITGIARDPIVLSALDPRHAFAFLGPKWRLWRDGFGQRVFSRLCWRRGTLRRYGTYWERPDPPFLVFYRLARAAAQLRRTDPNILLEKGNIAGNPFFQLAPAWSKFIRSLSHRDNCDDHREPSYHHGFLLDDAAGHATRLVTGSEYSSNLGSVYGQIYVPAIRLAVMMFTTVGITLAFRSSDKLAGAYGTAVSTTYVANNLSIVHCNAQKCGAGEFWWRTVSRGFFLSWTTPHSLAPTF